MKKSEYNFTLYKQVIEENQLCLTHNVKNKITGETWKAKIYDLDKIQLMNLQEVVEYNGQILTQMKNADSEAVLYLETVISKNNKQMHVVQTFSKRLTGYLDEVHPNGMKNQQEIISILKDVFEAVCEMLQEDYIVVNLRPQHFVQVFDPQNKWKIDTFVLDETPFETKSPFYFDYDWASNEEKRMKYSLDEELKDQQVVWYMGIFALRLLKGKNWKISKQFKDQELDTEALEKQCSPLLYELIEKSVRALSKDRIQLKKFSKLKIFSSLKISKQIQDKFENGYEYRSQKSQILKQTILRNSNLKKSLKPRMKTSPMQSSKTTHLVQFSQQSNPQKVQICQNEANLIYNQLRWALQKCFFMGQIKKYTQSNACFEGINQEDKALVRYIYLQIGHHNLLKLKSDLTLERKYKPFRQNHISKHLYRQILDDIEQNQKSELDSLLIQATRYQQRIKKLNPQKLSLLKNCENIVRDLKQNLNSEKSSFNTSIDSLANALKIVHFLIH